VTATSRPTGTLCVVATPIGNLGDLSPRAIEVLSSAALICCEDTRRTGLLLHRFGLAPGRLTVCNEHTEAARIDEVIAMLDTGGDVALVSDAGTPGISDPGQRLVRAVIDAGHRVSPLPGPVAAIAALVVSGAATDRFVVEGFLPRSGRGRIERLDEIATETRTMVLYEAPHRLVRTLEDLRRVCGDDRRITLARELTKLHEEIRHGTLGDLDPGEPRGEYVVVIEGRSSIPAEVDDTLVRDHLRSELAAGASTKDAAAVVAARLGVPRRDAYALALGLGREAGGQ